VRNKLVDFRRRFVGGAIALSLKLRHHVGDAIGRLQASNEMLREIRGPRSLANRVLLLHFVWAMLVYVLVMAAMWYAANSVIESSMRSQSVAWVNKLDEMGIPLYVSNKRNKKTGLFSDLRNFPDVIGVRYLDAEGKSVIAEYRRHNFGKVKFMMPDKENIERLKLGDRDNVRPIRFLNSDDNYLRLIAPLWFRSISSDGLFNFSIKDSVSEKKETIGYISVILDYSSASNTLNRNLFYASLIIAVLILIAAVIGRILIRWALYPLTRLEEPLTRLANGDTDVTVEGGGDLEIAQIGRALNTTINALRERDETLLRMAKCPVLL
jgi:methyl-accepting chemotaxis protein